MRRLWRSLIPVWILTLLLAAGCNSGGGKESGTDSGSNSGANAGANSGARSGTDSGSNGSGGGTADDASRFGGVFKAALSSPAPSLDIMGNISAATRTYTLFTLESLVVYAEDYSIIPQLAEKWATSEDGLTYTFTLRRGVKFHNGKEMTAEDVIASTKRFLDVTPRKASFTLLESYEATDPYTVVFKLSKPSMSFLDAMAYPVGFMAVMPKEIIEGKGVNELKTEEIIGTGPYTIASWQPDQAMVLKRYVDYKPLEGDYNGLGGGRVPYFDEIHLIPVAEPGARVAGLETGEYDYAEGIPTTEHDRLKEDPNIEPYVLAPQTWIVINFNHANQFSNNRKFRQAVQAALDMDAIGQAVTSGKPEFYRVEHSMWFRESPWFNDAGKDLYNQKNLEKAKQLLAESGYNGEEIVMVTNRNYEYMYKTIVAAADQLKKGLGMNVKVEVLDWPGQRQKWTEQTGWHMSTTGYLSQGIFAPDSFASVFHSGAGGAAERTFYDNPEMNQWFDKAAEAVTLEERKEAFTTVQRIFYDDVASLKIIDLHGLVALRKDIKDYRPWYNTTRFWSLYRAK